MRRATRDTVLLARASARFDPSSRAREGLGGSSARAFAAAHWVLLLCALAAPGRAEAPTPRAAPDTPTAPHGAPPEAGAITPAAPARTHAAPADAPARAAARPDTPARRLEEDLALLAKRHLAAPPAESVDELDQLLDDAHALARAGRKDEATLMLLEAVEGGRFRSFEPLDSFAAADLMLASLLIEQRALASAERSVARLLARGPGARSFGPAYRRAIDIALARGDYARSAEQLARKLNVPLPADAASELHYLRGLAAYALRSPAAARTSTSGAELTDAEREFAAVHAKSRFYANAQYLLGAMAAAKGDYEQADACFCVVRDLSAHSPRAAYESEQLSPSQDLAELGRARVAHERRTPKRAFDRYFRVPQDSPSLAEALFEAAYASYEHGHHTTALDSLAQLEARYPHSPYTAEARVLRGYVHLAQCDFARAERELSNFEQSFGAVLSEIDATLASPGETRRVFAAQAGAVGSREAAPDPLLLGLVARDPEVERLRAALAALDAELARSKGVGGSFADLAARVRGSQAPRARRDEPSAAEREEARRETLRAQSGEARAALAGLRAELRALRRAGAGAADLAPLERSARALAKRLDRLEAQLRALTRRAAAPERAAGLELGERLEHDAAYVEGVRGRARELRDRLELALDAAEQRALAGLRDHIEHELRRARVGRIDAVMGKKRKTELEIESLAAGRFPPDLASRHQRPNLLADDEEYWPFEGESWSDESAEPPP